MAVNLNELIDLNLLTYYDTNIKTWVSQQISGTVTSGTTLPTTGEEGVLYIVGTSLYLWDGTGYHQIGAGGEGIDEWADF